MQSIANLIGTIRSRRTTLSAAMLCLLIITSNNPMCAQSLDLNKQRGRIMLDVIRKDIEKNYYDPQFRGIDLQATFRAAQEKIKQAQSLGQIFGIIAQALTALEDSHTFFVPPDRTEHVDYGWQMGMVGEHCYVTAVKPGSDAAAKGLRVGDEVLSIDGRPPTRRHLWKIRLLATPGGQLDVVKWPFDRRINLIRWNRTGVKPSAARPA